MPAFWAKPFAHRGLHAPGATENSLAAVQAAADTGYGIEIDIQPARDGTPMVFHDYELERLTGAEGQISEIGREALKALTLPCGGPIPTLSHVLETIAGRVPVLIEIKDQDRTFGPNIGPLEAAVAELCLPYSEVFGAQTTAVMGFNPHSIVWFRENAPELLRGLVACKVVDPELSSERNEELGAMRSLPELDADFVSYGAKDFPSEATAALRRKGTPVFCWTIRSEGEAREALNHCDQITFEGYKPQLLD